MSGTAEFKNDLREKFKFINDYFINENIQTLLTGKNAINNENHINSFLEDLLSYNRFTDTQSPFKSFSTVDINTLLGGILIKKANASNYNIINFKNIDINNSSNWRISNDSNPDDILTSSYNFTPILKNNTTKGYANFKRAEINSEAGTMLSLLELLNTLRVTYNMLESEMLYHYIAKKTYNNKLLDKPILMYSMNKMDNGEYTNETINSIETIENMVKPIVDLEKLRKYIDTSRVEAIRRLVLLYEMIIHKYLSLYLLEKATVNTVKDDISARVIMYDICYDIIKQIIARNNAIGKIGGDVYKLMKDMQKRISTYKYNKGNIEKENTELIQNKEDIVIEKNVLDTSNKYSKKSNTILYFYLVTSLTIIASSIYMLYSPNVPYAIKKMVVSIFVAVSILLFIIMQIIKRFMLTENFIVSPNVSRKEINTTNNLDIYKNTLLTTLNEEMLKYLNNTINVVSFMESYKTYGNINYSMNKEYQYYKNLNDILAIDKNKMDQANRVNYYNSYVTRYRIYFFITLLLTITILSLLSIYAPAGQDFFTILGIVILIIITYLYIVNVNNLVRTDGKKLYWGHPDKNTF